jgi:hypothetical protein
MGPPKPRFKCWSCECMEFVEDVERRRRVARWEPLHRCRLRSKSERSVQSKTVARREARERPVGGSAHPSSKGRAHSTDS